MAVDFLATRPHYVDHLAPVWKALAPEERGAFHVPSGLMEHLRRRGVEPSPLGPPLRTTIVAGWSDVVRARAGHATAIVRLEHGIGQSYDPIGHPSYVGGHGHGDVALFLVPNQTAADRWLRTYPKARVEVVGCPKLDTTSEHHLSDSQVVAISFHWPAEVAPETGNAFHHFRNALPDLARRFTVIGHGHPRAMPELARHWDRIGIPVVHDFEEVLHMAAVYVCDNSSTLYEFAATGRPVVVLDAPAYRRDVHHGLRFWAAADVGIRISHPDQLVDAIERALADPPEVAAARESALQVVYAHRTGAAQRAADAIRTAFGLRVAA